MAAVELDNATGEARLAFGDKTYVVRPPLLGQMRELDILAEELDAKQNVESQRRAADALAQGDEIDDDTRAALATRSVSDGVPEILPWWRRLFELCCDQPLPPDDDCPLWMGTPILVTRIQVHWTLHPFVGLGSPLPDPETGTG